MVFSFFGIFDFVLEIFAFLYYANEESGDVIHGSSKIRGGWTHGKQHFGLIFVVTMCFSLHDRSWCLELWLGHRRSIKIRISFIRCSGNAEH